ncbi:MAG: TIM barrel protein [Trueperaceae bacterium]|nr:MAG: TIM barrel protein [Trueperaceae bacterium]
MKTILGTAPDSWGVWFPHDSKQILWSRYLDEVAEAGYSWTELGPFGYLPTDPMQLEDELSARELSLCGGTIGGALTSREAVQVLGGQLVELASLLLHSEVARTIVLLPESYSDMRTGKQIMSKEASTAQWRQMVDAMHRFGDLAGERGFQLLFHPHADSWVETEDQIARFLDDTDPDLVGLCFDTGHHAYCGGDAVAFFHGYHQRIPYLHLKSIDPLVLKASRREHLGFAQAVARGVMCEPSAGSIDFAAFRDVLTGVGFEGFAIVEQDMYPVAVDRPLPIAQRTRAYLVELGFGDG